MTKVTIQRLGHHGDGIAEGPVYVPLSLPGEEVEGVLDGDKLREGRIVTPSDARVRPPCSHFKSCGGCALQHASDDFVAAWKVGVVQTALDAQGLTAPMRPILTSPPKSRRRAVLSARRTKKGALVGFHARASDTIIPIPSCTLLHPDLMAAIPALEQLTMAGASRKGEASFTVSLSQDGVDVAARGVKPMDKSMFLPLVEIAQTHDLARLTWEEEVVVTRRPPRQRFGMADVVPPAGAFLQATAEGQQALTDAVREAVGNAAQVVDLFAGSGTFSLPLAKTAEVVAVEGDADMMTALDQGWRRAQGLKRVKTETRDLFRRPMMPDELDAFDAICIDPPRAGAEAQFREIARSDVPVIAAVSCNPVTFARDAKVLVGAGYTLDWVQVVDQFRWSPHIEIAARFSK
ncbi:RNA methyltransferase [Actibacterium pelagium]|uniref:RNA methyltransferase n=2 Tax=Actibacterium pelagium TaxID=2029103 RepID=A0A917AJP4_9RHOB|nr:RsmD family RNA methyltransferase [Actibacterium pelagium]GGE55622.1 RNA methyltransferase [Actibacterium pelagium]